jgi:hypothetical protein
LAYVAIIPRDYRVTLPSGTVIRADQAVKAAVFERRSCGSGTKGPRLSDWAITATGIPGQCLPIRRLISRLDQLTFCLCWAPPGRPMTMTYFIKRCRGKRRSGRAATPAGTSSRSYRSASGLARDSSVHRHGCVTRQAARADVSGIEMPCWQ